MRAKSTVTPTSPATRQLNEQNTDVLLAIGFLLIKRLIRFRSATMRENCQWVRSITITAVTENLLSLGIS
jgi:hypothetical protein